MLEKLLGLLKACPTCGKALSTRAGTSILECPDKYHGRFVIEQIRGGGYHITYEPKAQALR